MLFILIFFLVIIIIGVLWSTVAHWTNRRQAVARMRSLWGKAHERFFAGRDPTLYHNLKAEHEDFHDIDDQTWEDLYLTDVFRALDHTRSRVGSQMLYHLLRTPSLNAEEIASRSRLIELFTADTKLRETMQAVLDELESDDAGLLPNLFYRQMPPRPVEYLLYPFLALCSLVGVVVVVYHPLYWPYLLPFLSINVGIAMKYRGKVQQWIQPLRVLNTLVYAARQFGRLSEEKSHSDLENVVAPLRKEQEALRVLDGSTRWLLLEHIASRGMMAIVVEYLNMILLLDVNAFLFSMEAVRQQRQLIQTLFEMIGTLDAMIAIASYRHSLPYHCAPIFTEQGKHLRVEEALHPLLPGGVKNSLAVDERSVLVTGSNMSGKTTFIRTVAVNTVLAQTVATCLATRYEATLFNVQTSIGRTDSLSEGKSYYMAEVEAIGDFLAAAAGPTPYLFIIDEIFRGTNTTERIAASKAVLDALNRSDGPHVVLISTHDIELSSLLRTAWDRYHFQEAVQDGELIFDYTIRTGLCSSRNALRLLAARNYPASVVADAEATATQIDIN